MHLQRDPFGVRQSLERDRPVHSSLQSVSLSSLRRSVGGAKHSVTQGANEFPETAYFPQMADPLVPGVGFLRSVIVLTNSGASRASGVLRVTSSGGGALIFPTELGVDEEVHFTIAPESSITIPSLGRSNPPPIGWARVDSDSPVGASLIFQFFDAAGILCGRLDCPARVCSIIFAVSGEARSNINSAIALANPGQEETEVTMQLKKEGKTLIVSTKKLKPGTQESFFITELGLSLDSFEGTLFVRTSSKIIAVVLRTLSGLPSSGLPIK